MLAGISRVIDLWGNIACCGMAGGIGFAATNLPLILRGVSLLGISSSNAPYAMREILWERLGNGWRPRHMDAIITNEVKLYLQGKYGNPPGKVNESLRQKAIGNAEVIDCRPADLLPAPAGP